MTQEFKNVSNFEGILEFKNKHGFWYRFIHEGSFERKNVWFVYKDEGDSFLLKTKLFVSKRKNSCEDLYDAYLDKCYFEDLAAQSRYN